MPDFRIVQVPDGDIIGTRENGALDVPDHPIVGWIEGDGIGPDIWAATRPVLDAVVQHCYGPKRKIAWMQLPAGEAALEAHGTNLPEETLEAIRAYHVAIKGPLRTPVGGGHRSLNVTLRQKLDLFACVRPVRYFDGLPSPVTRPEAVDMIVFRENTEDVYAGMEIACDDPLSAEIRGYLAKNFDWHLSPDTGLGLKPVTEHGSKRLVRAAIRYAISHRRNKVTLVHKGNIMKHTEGAFLKWGYEVARDEFPEETAVVGHDQEATSDKIVINDCIADSFFQQSLLNPHSFDVVATLNLNGDYISDALAAQVGGLGIAPGANINYETGAALFEPTHGVAAEFAGLNQANPSSLILSGVMFFDHLGWSEAAEALERALFAAYQQRTLTCDFARRTPGAVELSTTSFGEVVVDQLAAG